MNITILGIISVVDPLREFGTGARQMRLQTVRVREFETVEEAHPSDIPVEFWNKYADEFREGGYRAGETVQIEAKLTSSSKGYASVRARGIVRPVSSAPAEGREAKQEDGEMPF